ncbi:rCG59831, isoform CRA_b [Rattus norvegicus]|uniref:RCG59831, isoform CRA_b n=1 Tax=Rattus norvegicus TaxID=10116 RepID=A6HQX2_RAT|nr:rCG59831, isoform CRA_b [Rattus norvegicus]
MSVIPSSRPVSTLAPDNDFREIHNWTELLHLFNQTFSDCHMELNENTKQVVLFVFYLAIFVHSIIITKEGSLPAAADLHTHAIRNVQASSLPPNTSPTLCNSIAS